MEDLSTRASEEPFALLSSLLPEPPRHSLPLLALIEFLVALRVYMMLYMLYILVLVVMFLEKEMPYRYRPTEPRDGTRQVRDFLNWV